jgi:hypothetical protein
MTIQQRPGTTWPKAYGYGQVLSGSVDGLLARSLAQIKTMKHNSTTFTIQLASEFDTDHEFGTTAYTWAQADARTAYDVFNRTRAQAVADLPAAWLEKPVTIAEWGTAEALGDQAAWIRTVPAAPARLNSEPGPSIVVANHFNSTPAWATLDPKAAGLAGLLDAYAAAPFK